MVWWDGRRIGGSHADALIQSGPLERAGENLDDAESQSREALRALEHASEPDDPALIRPLRELAHVLIAQFSLEEAESLLIRALDLSERAEGPRDDELPTLLGGLSRLYILRSAYDLAEPPLVRLLAMAEAQGEDGPDVATALTNLAAVRHLLGEYTSAEALYRRALSLHERTLPHNDLATAATLESLAETCAARGRIAEAVSLYARSLSLRELTLGADDDSVRAAIARLADLQLEAQEDSRFATPPRSAPALRATPLVEQPQRERAPVAGASPLPNVVIPEWTSSDLADFAALEPTDETRPSKTMVVVVGVVVVLAGLGVASLLGRSRQSRFLVDQPYTVTQREEVVPSASRAGIDTPSRPAVTPKVVARERPRPQAPAPRPAAAKPPARENGLPTSVADSAPTRALAPVVERAPEARGTAPASTSPTSPTLIGAAPQPQYPAALREQRIEGDVVVQFVVDETGRPDVSSMTVVRSPHVLLTNAVLAVVSQFRFEPARTALPQSLPRPETVRRVFTFRAPRP